MSCTSDDILEQVAGFDTARETWLILEKFFASRSRARMIQMKEELHNLKNNISIAEYVLKVKVLTDELVPVGCPISEEEKLMYILSGLDEKFDNVFSTITKKMLTEKVIIDDAKVLLLSHESRLERRKLVSMTNLPSVNLSVKNGANSSFQSEASDDQEVFDKNTITSALQPVLQNVLASHASSNFPQNFPPPQHPMISQFNNFGRGRGRGRFNNRPQCQLSHCLSMLVHV